MRPACFHRASSPTSFDKDRPCIESSSSASCWPRRCRHRSATRPHRARVAPVRALRQNVLPVVVNGGPTNNALNQLFASVTVCVPGTSNCQTISGILVDTGSVGLRVLSSALTLPLPQQTGARWRARGRVSAVRRRIHVGSGTDGRCEDGRRNREQHRRSGGRPRQIPDDPEQLLQPGHRGRNAERSECQRHSGRRAVPRRLRPGLRAHGLVESGAVLHLPVVRLCDHHRTSGQSGSESGVALRRQQQRRRHSAPDGPDGRRGFDIRDADCSASARRATTGSARRRSSRSTAKPTSRRSSTVRRTHRASSTRARTASSSSTQRGPVFQTARTARGSTARRR